MTEHFHRIDDMIVDAKKNEIVVGSLGIAWGLVEVQTLNKLSLIRETSHENQE